MTHRQDNCSGGKRARNLKQLLEEYERSDPRRPLLFSSQDSQRLAALSRRARMARRLHDEDPRRDRDDPATTPKKHSHKRKPVIPLYPSMVQQTLRWYPYVRVSQSDVCDKKHTCRCDNCTSSRCPAKTVGGSKRCSFKDNIVTFCNKHTMTPLLTDVSCNVCKSLTYVPDLCSRSSLSVVRDPGACVKQSYTKCLPPILKKCSDFSYDCFQRKSFDYPQAAVRDTDVGCYTKCKPRAARPCGRYQEATNCTQTDANRKILYNEGISDCMGSRYPMCPRRLPSTCNLPRDCTGRAISPCNSVRDCAGRTASQCNLLRECSGKVSSRCNLPRSCLNRTTSPCYLPPPCNLQRDCSRGSIRERTCRSRCYIDIDGYIPYSHTGHSKYHQNCQKSGLPPPFPACDLRSSKTRLDDPSPAPTHQCPLARKAWCRKPEPCRSPCINLPRKVLPSEKNIDSYIRISR